MKNSLTTGSCVVCTALVSFLCTNGVSESHQLKLPRTLVEARGSGSFRQGQQPDLKQQRLTFLFLQDSENPWRNEPVVMTPRVIETKPQRLG